MIPQNINNQNLPLWSNQQTFLPIYTILQTTFALAQDVTSFRWNFEIQVLILKILNLIKAVFQVQSNHFVSSTYHHDDSLLIITKKILNRTSWTFIRIILYNFVNPILQKLYYILSKWHTPYNTKYNRNFKRKFEYLLLLSNWTCLFQRHLRYWFWIEFFRRKVKRPPHNWSFLLT